MPTSLASVGAMASVHCSGWSKKPSSLTSTAMPSTVRVVMMILL